VCKTIARIALAGEVSKIRYLALPQVDGEVYELTVLLHKLLDPVWLEVIMSFLFQEQAAKMHK